MLRASLYFDFDFQRIFYFLSEKRLPFNDTGYRPVRFVFYCHWWPILSCLFCYWWWFNHWWLSICNMLLVGLHTWWPLPDLNVNEQLMFVYGCGCDVSSQTKNLIWLSLNIDSNSFSLLIFLLYSRHRIVDNFKTKMIRFSNILLITVAFEFGKCQNQQQLSNQQNYAEPLKPMNIESSADRKLFHCFKWEFIECLCVFCLFVSLGIGSVPISLIPIPFNMVRYQAMIAHRKKRDLSLDTIQCDIVTFDR